MDINKSKENRFKWMKTHLNGMPFKLQFFNEVLLVPSKSYCISLAIKKKAIVLEHFFRNIASFPILTDYKSPVLQSWYVVPEQTGCLS